MKILVNPIMKNSLSYQCNFSTVAANTSGSLLSTEWKGNVNCNDNLKDGEYSIWELTDRWW